MSLTLANTRCSLLALLLPSIPITLLNVPTMTLATPPSQGPGRSGQTWKGIRAEHTSTRPDIGGHAHRYKSGHWEMLLFCTTLTVLPEILEFNPRFVILPDLQQQLL